MAYEQVKVKTPLILRLLSVLSIVLFFGTWQMVVDWEIVPSTMLASPIQIFQLFLVKWTEVNPDGALLSQHIWTSVQEAFAGYLLALLVGIPLGLAMGWFIVVEGLSRPIFEMIRPIPAVAWIPLVIFWFGIGISGKIFIIWIGGIV
ncbi:MAG: ABC transporter permease, partial [Deltaproteobacteria bacterium]|nr:ABC transporter permease [Deltaproteobacteria bacterium]